MRCRLADGRWTVDRPEGVTLECPGCNAMSMETDPQGITKRSRTPRRSDVMHEPLAKEMERSDERKGSSEEKAMSVSSCQKLKESR